MKNITDLKDLLYNDTKEIKKKEQKHQKDLADKIQRLDDLITYIKKDIYTNISTQIFKNNYKLIYPDKDLPKILSNADYKKILHRLISDYKLKILEYNNLYYLNFNPVKQRTYDIIEKLKKNIPLNINETNYIEKD